MYMRTSKEVFREMIHWLWLWMLAAIVISVLQSLALGDERAQPEPAVFVAKRSGSTTGSTPKIDHPDRDRTPYGITKTKNATLRDVLLLNQSGDYKSVINVWEQLDIARESVAWKHVGVGVAQLRRQSLDQAHEQFSRAVKVDPDNAVAEYFLGRVCQAKGRGIPFWQQTQSESPFRLIVFNPHLTQSRSDQGLDRGDAFLPHSKTSPFDKQAKTHYRRAIRFGPDCDLDRAIDFVVPRLRLINQLSEQKPVTVRDLLISLDEENYVEKARLEVDERLVRGD
jgi:tetratricopeptide (TPR) repeat protein